MANSHKKSLLQSHCKKNNNVAKAISLGLTPVAFYWYSMAIKANPDIDVFEHINNLSIDDLKNLLLQEINEDHASVHLNGVDLDVEPDDAITVDVAALNLNESEDEVEDDLEGVDDELQTKGGAVYYNTVSEEDGSTSESQSAEAYDYSSISVVIAMFSAAMAGAAVVLASEDRDEDPYVTTAHQDYIYYFNQLTDVHEMVGVVYQWVEDSEVVDITMSAFDIIATFIQGVLFSGYIESGEGESGRQVPALMTLTGMLEETEESEVDDGTNFTPFELMFDAVVTVIDETETLGLIDIHEAIDLKLMLIDGLDNFNYDASDMIPLLFEVPEEEMSVNEAVMYMALMKELDDRGYEHYWLREQIDSFLEVNGLFKISESAETSTGLNFNVNLDSDGDMASLDITIPKESLYLLNDLNDTYIRLQSSDKSISVNLGEIIGTHAYTEDLMIRVQAKMMEVNGNEFSKVYVTVLTMDEEDEVFYIVSHKSDKESHYGLQPVGQVTDGEVLSGFDFDLNESVNISLFDGARDLSFPVTASLLSTTAQLNTDLLSAMAQSAYFNENGDFTYEDIYQALNDSIDLYYSNHAASKSNYHSLDTVANQAFFEALKNLYIDEGVDLFQNVMDSVPDSGGLFFVSASMVSNLAEYAYMTSHSDSFTDFFITNLSDLVTKGIDNVDLKLVIDTSVPEISNASEFVVNQIDTFRASVGDEDFFDGLDMLAQDGDVASVVSMYFLHYAFNNLATLNANSDYVVNPEAKEFIASIINMSQENFQFFIELVENNSLTSNMPYADYHDTNGSPVLNGLISVENLVSMISDVSPLTDENAISEPFMEVAATVLKYADDTQYQTINQALIDALALSIHSANVETASLSLVSLLNQFVEDVPGLIPVFPHLYDENNEAIDLSLDILTVSDANGGLSRQPDLQEISEDFEGFTITMTNGDDSVPVVLDKDQTEVAVYFNIENVVSFTSNFDALINVSADHVLDSIVELPKNTPIEILNGDTTVTVTVDSDDDPVVDGLDHYNQNLRQVVEVSDQLSISTAPLVAALHEDFKVAAQGDLQKALETFPDGSDSYTTNQEELTVKWDAQHQSNYDSNSVEWDVNATVIFDTLDDLNDFIGGDNDVNGITDLTFIRSYTPTAIEADVDARIVDTIHYHVNDDLLTASSETVNGKRASDDSEDGFDNIVPYDGTHTLELIAQTDADVGSAVMKRIETTTPNEPTSDATVNTTEIEMSTGYNIDLLSDVANTVPFELITTEKNTVSTKIGVADSTIVSQDEKTDTYSTLNLLLADDADVLFNLETVNMIQSMNDEFDKLMPVIEASESTGDEEDTDPAVADTDGADSFTPLTSEQFSTVVSFMSQFTETSEHLVNRVVSNDNSEEGGSYLKALLSILTSQELPPAQTVNLANAYLSIAEGQSNIEKLGYDHALNAAIIQADEGLLGLFDQIVSIYDEQGQPLSAIRSYSDTGAELDSTYAGLYWNINPETMDSYTWDEYRDICTAMDAHLITISDEEENTWVGDLGNDMWVLSDIHTGSNLVYLGYYKDTEQDYEDRKIFVEEFFGIYGYSDPILYSTIQDWSTRVSDLTDNQRINTVTHKTVTTMYDENGVSETVYSETIESQPHGSANHTVLFQGEVVVVSGDEQNPTVNVYVKTEDYDTHEITVESFNDYGNGFMNQSTVQYKSGLTNDGAVKIETFRIPANESIIVNPSYDDSSSYRWLETEYERENDGVLDTATVDIYTVTTKQYDISGSIPVLLSEDTVSQAWQWVDDTPSCLIGTEFSNIFYPRSDSISDMLYPMGSEMRASYYDDSYFNAFQGPWSTDGAWSIGLEGAPDAANTPDDFYQLYPNMSLFVYASGASWLTGKKDHVIADLFRGSEDMYNQSCKWYQYSWWSREHVQYCKMNYDYGTVVEENLNCYNQFGSGPFKGPNEWEYGAGPILGSSYALARTGPLMSAFGYPYGSVNPGWTDDAGDGNYGYFPGMSFGACEFETYRPDLVSQSDISHYVKMMAMSEGGFEQFLQLAQELVDQSVKQELVDQSVNSELTGSLYANLAFMPLQVRMANDGFWPHWSGYDVDKDLYDFTSVQQKEMVNALLNSDLVQYLNSVQLNSLLKYVDMKAPDFVQSEIFTGLTNSINSLVQEAAGLYLYDVSETSTGPTQSLQAAMSIAGQVKNVYDNYFQYDGHTYVTVNIKDATTYHELQDIADNFHGKLVAVDDVLENEFLHELSYSKEANLLLGIARDEAEIFRLDQGNVAVIDTKFGISFDAYTNFASGYPGSNDDFVFMTPDGEWVSASQLSGMAVIEIPEIIDFGAENPTSYKNIYKNFKETQDAIGLWDHQAQSVLLSEMLQNGLVTEEQVFELTEGEGYIVSFGKESLWPSSGASFYEGAYLAYAGQMGYEIYGVGIDEDGHQKEDLIVSWRKMENSPEARADYTGSYSPSTMNKPAFISGEYDSYEVKMSVLNFFDEVGFAWVDAIYNTGSSIIGSWHVFNNESYNDDITFYLQTADLRSTVTIRREIFEASAQDQHPGLEAPDTDSEIPDSNVDSGRLTTSLTNNFMYGTVLPSVLSTSEDLPVNIDDIGDNAILISESLYLEPSKIFTSLINDDNKEDAVALTCIYDNVDIVVATPGYFGEQVPLVIQAHSELGSTFTLGSQHLDEYMDDDKSAYYKATLDSIFSLGEDELLEKEIIVYSSDSKISSDLSGDIHSAGLLIGAATDDFSADRSPLMTGSTIVSTDSDEGSDQVQYSMKLYSGAMDNVLATEGDKIILHSAKIDIPSSSGSYEWFMTLHDDNVDDSNYTLSIVGRNESGNSQVLQDITKIAGTKEYTFEYDADDVAKASVNSDGSLSFYIVVEYDKTAYEELMEKIDPLQRNDDFIHLGSYDGHTYYLSNTFSYLTSTYSTHYGYKYTMYASKEHEAWQAGDGYGVDGADIKTYMAILDGNGESSNYSGAGMNNAKRENEGILKLLQDFNAEGRYNELTNYNTNTPLDHVLLGAQDFRTNDEYHAMTIGPSLSPFAYSDSFISYCSDVDGFEHSVSHNNGQYYIGDWYWMDKEFTRDDESSPWNYCYYGPSSLSDYYGGDAASSPTGLAWSVDGIWEATQGYEGHHFWEERVEPDGTVVYGAAVNGAYTNWADGEPNNNDHYGYSENYLSMQITGDNAGKWNDIGYYAYQQGSMRYGSMIYLLEAEPNLSSEDETLFQNLSTPVTVDQITANVGGVYSPENIVDLISLVENAENHDDLIVLIMDDISSSEMNVDFKINEQANLFQMRMMATDQVEKVVLQIQSASNSGVTYSQVIWGDEFEVRGDELEIYGTSNWIDASKLIVGDDDDDDKSMTINSIEVYYRNTSGYQQSVSTGSHTLDFKDGVSQSLSLGVVDIADYDTSNMLLNAFEGGADIFYMNPDLFSIVSDENSDDYGHVWNLLNEVFIDEKQSCALNTLNNISLTASSILELENVYSHAFSVDTTTNTNSYKLDLTFEFADRPTKQITLAPESSVINVGTSDIYVAELMVRLLREQLESYTFSEDDRQEGTFYKGGYFDSMKEIINFTLSAQSDSGAGAAIEDMWSIMAHAYLDGHITLAQLESLMFSDEFSDNQVANTIEHAKDHLANIIENTYIESMDDYDSKIWKWHPDMPSLASITQYMIVRGGQEGAEDVVETLLEAILYGYLRDNTLDELLSNNFGEDNFYVNLEYDDRKNVVDAVIDFLYSFAYLGTGDAYDYNLDGVNDNKFNSIYVNTMLSSLVETGFVGELKLNNNGEVVKLDPVFDFNNPKLMTIIDTWLDDFSIGIVDNRDFNATKVLLQDNTPEQEYTLLGIKLALEYAAGKGDVSDAIYALKTVASLEDVTAHNLYNNTGVLVNQLKLLLLDGTITFDDVLKNMQIFVTGEDGIDLDYSSPYMVDVLTSAVDYYSGLSDLSAKAAIIGLLFADGVGDSQFNIGSGDSRQTSLEIALENLKEITASDADSHDLLVYEGYDIYVIMQAVKEALGESGPLHGYFEEHYLAEFMADHSDGSVSDLHAKVAAIKEGNFLTVLDELTIDDLKVIVSQGIQVANGHTVRVDFVEDNDFAMLIVNKLKEHLDEGELELEDIAIMLNTNLTHHPSLYQGEGEFEDGLWVIPEPVIIPNRYDDNYELSMYSSIVPVFGEEILSYSLLPVHAIDITSTTNNSNVVWSLFSLEDINGDDTPDNSTADLLLSGNHESELSTTSDTFYVLAGDNSDYYAIEIRNTELDSLATTTLSAGFDEGDVFFDQHFTVDGDECITTASLGSILNTDPNSTFLSQITSDVDNVCDVSLFQLSDILISAQADEDNQYYMLEGSTHTLVYDLEVLATVGLQIYDVDNFESTDDNSSLTASLEENGARLEIFIEFPEDSTDSGTSIELTSTGATVTPGYIYDSNGNVVPAYDITESVIIDINENVTIYENYSSLTTVERLEMLLDELATAPLSLHEEHIELLAEQINIEIVGNQTDGDFLDDVQAKIDVFIDDIDNNDGALDNDEYNYYTLLNALFFDIGDFITLPSAHKVEMTLDYANSYYCSEMGVDWYVGTLDTMVELMKAMPEGDLSDDDLIHEYHRGYNNYSCSENETFTYYALGNENVDLVSVLFLKDYYGDSWHGSSSAKVTYTIDGGDPVDMSFVIQEPYAVSGYVDENIYNLPDSNLLTTTIDALYMKDDPENNLLNPDGNDVTDTELCTFMSEENGHLYPYDIVPTSSPGADYNSYQVNNDVNFNNWSTFYQLTVIGYIDIDDDSDCTFDDGGVVAE